MSDVNLLMMGPASTMIGGQVRYHHLSRLARRGAIPFVVVGHLRLIRPSDLPAIRDVCKRFGYFKTGLTDVTGATITDSPSIQPAAATAACC